jgi:hypothetical protein
MISAVVANSSAAGDGRRADGVALFYVGYDPMLNVSYFCLHRLLYLHLVSLPLLVCRLPSVGSDQTAHVSQRSTSVLYLLL